MRHALRGIGVDKIHTDVDEAEMDVAEVVLVVVDGAVGVLLC